MKQNILLAFVSTGLCLLAGVFVVSRILPTDTAAPGSVFRDVDEFRRKLMERDERDIKSDSSVSFRSIVKPHPADSILYELRDNLDVRFQKVRVRTNSHGMRNTEIALSKPPGVYRIALLGDSFAFGWGVEQEKIFARVMQDELNRSIDLPERKVEVLNFGVPGYSSFQQVAQFLESGKGFEPDLVLVFFVDNDFGLPFLIRRFDGSNSLTSASHFEKLRHKTKDQSVVQRQRRFVGDINPNRHLALLADEMAKQKVPVLITINPRKNIDYDIKRLYVLRHHDNVRYVSIKEEYSRLLKQKGLTRQDVTLVADNHPNALRHSYYGKILAQKLLPFVSKN